MSAGDRTRQRGITLAIGGLALAARLAHLISLRELPTFSSPVMDEAYHHEWARRLAGGDWIGQEIFFRAPLYPYLLGLLYAIFGEGGMGPRLVQILIGSASAALTHRIALRLMSPAAAGVAGLLTALCWPLIYFDGELLITVLEVFLGLLTIRLLIGTVESPRPGPLIAAAGLSAGLAAVARPNMLVPAAAAAIWLGRPGAGRSGAGLRAAALFLAAVCAPILPVTLRNAAVGGDLVLISSQGGVNFYIGNNPLSDGATAIVPGTRPTWDGGYQDAIARARQDTGETLRPSGISRYWFRRGLAFWAQDPAGALKLTLRKTWLFFCGLEISNNKDLAFFRSLSPVLSLPLPGASLLAPLGLLGWAVSWRHAERAPAGGRAFKIVALYGLAYSGSVIVFFVNSRYRAPILPVFALGVGLLLDRIVLRWKSGRIPGVVLPLACAAAALIVMNLNLTGARDDPGQGLLLLGLAHAQAGRHSDAIRMYDRSAAAGGPYAYEALRQKGESLLALGRASEACDALLASLRARPENDEAMGLLLRGGWESGRYEELREEVLELARASTRAQAPIHFAVGSADQLLGRPDRAEEQYRLALGADPRHLGAAINLALVLRATGRLDASLAALLQAERLHPGSALVHENLARHMLFVGRRQEALRHAARARELGARLDPEFERALALP